MSWFDYSQNNSGGGFHVNDQVGQYVLIEATSPYRADLRAEEIGIYFDGVEDDRDCDCCGDRWDRQFENATGTETPTLYGKSLDDFKPHFMGDEPVVVMVYPLEGEPYRREYTRFGTQQDNDDQED